MKSIGKKNEKTLEKGESGLQWRQVVRSGEKWHIVEANGVLRLRERVRMLLGDIIITLMKRAD